MPICLSAGFPVGTDIPLPMQEPFSVSLSHGTSQCGIPRKEMGNIRRLRIRSVPFLAENILVLRATHENQNLTFGIRNKFSIFKIQMIKPECTLSDIIRDLNLAF